jgi:hypothetical protein
VWLRAALENLDDEHAAAATWTFVSLWDGISVFARGRSSGQQVASAASRSASHCLAAAPWHFGQCRLRQLL